MTFTSGYHSGFFVSGVFFMAADHPVASDQTKLGAVGPDLRDCREERDHVAHGDVAQHLLAAPRGTTRTTTFPRHALSLRRSADRAAILWVCGDFWPLPALIVVVARAIKQEGNAGDLVDRMLHREPLAMRRCDTTTRLGQPSEQSMRNTRAAKAAFQLTTRSPAAPLLASTHHGSRSCRCCSCTHERRERLRQGSREARQVTAHKSHVWALLMTRSRRNA